MSGPVEIRYTIRFLSRHGCDDAVVRGMLRHDSQYLVNWGRVENGHGFAWIEVAALYRRSNAPTMAMWDSFAVGAQIVHEREIF